MDKNNLGIIKDMAKLFFSNNFVRFVLYRLCRYGFDSEKPAE